MIDVADTGGRQPPVGRRIRLATVTPLMATVVLLLLVGYTHGTRRTTVDGFVDATLVPLIDPASTLLAPATELLGPTKMLAVSVALGVLCLLVGDRHGGLLAFVAPFSALAVTEVVLKPLVGRPPDQGEGLAFPSGHATACVALATTALVVSCEGSPLAGSLPRVLVLLGRVAAWTVPLYLAAALLLFRHHYVTDIVGGAAVAVAVVSALALMRAGRLSRHGRTSSAEIVGRQND